MARAALRPVGYDERLSLVEHLDELRTRLIICVAAFLVCFGVAFWQNDTLLDIMNRPLEKTAFKSGSEDPFERSANFQQKQKALLPQGGGGVPRAGGRRRSSARDTRAMFERARRRTAARDRGRDAGAVGQAAGHAGRRRAVHGDVQGRRLRGAAARVAAAALPGVRVRAAGVLPARARGRACRCCSACRSCSSPAWCSRTTWCCRRRSASCRTSTTTPTTSCCRRGTSTRSRSWC